MCIGYTSAIFESSLEFMGSWSGSFWEWKCARRPHCWKAAGTHGNVDPIVKKFKNAHELALHVLLTCISNHFPAKTALHWRLLHTQSQKFSGVIPRTLAAGRGDPVPHPHVAGVQTPSVLGSRHQFPHGSPHSVLIFSVLRNDHWSWLFWCETIRYETYGRVFFR